MKRILCGVISFCMLCTSFIGFAKDEEYTYKDVSYDFSKADIGNMGVWNVYLSPDNTDLAKSYTAVKPTKEGEKIKFSPYGGDKPAIFYNVGNSKGEFIISPESDNAIKKPAGLLIEFIAPYSGDFQIDFAVQNIGSEVLGGDGGWVKITVLGEKDEYDNAAVDKINVVPSKQNPDVATLTKTIRVKKGTRVMFRANSNVDGFGDVWNCKLNIKSTKKKGAIIENHGVDGYISQTPSEKKPKGVPAKDNMFWFAADAGWCNSPYANESVELFKKYLPNLGVVMVGSFPEFMNKAEYYQKMGIPTLTQTHGPDYAKYYDLTNAWEVNWKGDVLDAKSGYVLGGGGHAVAIPHESNYKAYENIITSSIDNGFTGFGYQDYVWMWGGGRGASGYNEQTISAFKEDLQGLDQGIRVWKTAEKCETLKLADYAEFYLGNMVEPSQFGIKDWSEYTPLTYDEFELKKKEDYNPDFLLFDLLCGYEWLKFAQFMGDTAESQGGMAQVMPNPEDMASGADFLFLSGLDNVSKITEEFFNHPYYLDGAYYHFPYMKSWADNANNSDGIVLECGFGGNEGGYYDYEIAWLNAYELTAAAGIDHMEGDFWIGAQGPLDDLVKDKSALQRYRTMFSYGLGFRAAKEDNLERMKPDFKSFTSRRIFRPWGAEYNPWTWNLHSTNSPEIVLAKGGFEFEGNGEEGLQNIKDKQKVVVYSPDSPTEHYFNMLCGYLKDGMVENVLTPAGSIQKVVTKDFYHKPINEVYSDFAFETEAVDVKGDFEGKEYSLKGNMYKTLKGEKVLYSLGNKPIVVEKKVGDGSMKLVMFDVYDMANFDLTKAVYTKLLGDSGVKPRWVSVKNTGELLPPVTKRDEFTTWSPKEKDASVRVYKNDKMYVVGVQNTLSRLLHSDKTNTIDAMIPYKIKGETQVKVQVEANVDYDYIAMPSMKKGEVLSDKDGFVDLGFKDTSHEIFYLSPKKDGGSANFQDILARKYEFDDALTIGGKVPLADTMAPSTVAKVEDGNLMLTAFDGNVGSKVFKTEYNMDGKGWANFINRDANDKKSFKNTIKVGKGKHIVEYRSVDGKGNIEEINKYEFEI